MPTEFSKCKECFHLKSESLNNDVNKYNKWEDNDVNKYYKWHYDKMEALKDCGFPTEIAIKIVEMTNTYTECDYCDKILCTVHKDQGLRYGNSWPYIKCNACCWNDIT